MKKCALLRIRGISLQTSKVLQRWGLRGSDSLLYYITPPPLALRFEFSNQYTISSILILNFSVQAGSIFISYLTHTFVEKTLSRLQKDTIPSLVLYGLTINGKTIDELGIRHKGDYSQSTWRSKPIWHKKRDLDQWIADEMRLSAALWGPDRKSNDLMTFTSRELGKLRKKDTLVDWNVNKRISLFRLSDPTMMVSRPTMSKKKNTSEPIQTAPTETDMKKAFMSIISSPNKDNTYKFTLGKTLLDYCKANPLDGTVQEIKYDYLAGEFLRHYWYQKYKFRLKQDFHTLRKPVVMSVLEKVFGDEQRTKFEKINPEQMAQARKLIRQRVFGKAIQKKGMVVPRFQRSMDGNTTRDSTIFYDYDDEQRVIFLNPEAHAFFRNNYALLTRALLAEWILYLERVNHGLPMLAAKIDREEAERGDLTKYKIAFCSMDETHCFYCNSRLERDNIEVDHFIPWSYIFEDSAWNLVMSCKRCNQGKSNSLPPQVLVGDLINRDEKYYEDLPIMRKSIRELSIKGAGTWKKEIHNYYTICREYGFGHWSIR